MVVGGGEPSCSSGCGRGRGGLLSTGHLGITSHVDILHILLDLGIRIPLCSPSSLLQENGRGSPSRGGGHRRAHKKQ